MAERPPATDLRGGNTSEDSFTRLMANLVVAYAVDPQSDVLSGAVPGSAVRSDDFGVLSWSFPGTERVVFGAGSGSGTRKRWLDEPCGIKQFTCAYH